MKEFKYLGANIKADVEKEITNRLQKGGKFYQTIECVWDKKAKLTMHRIYYVPTIT